MIQTEKVHEWLMKLDYENAVTFIEFAANVANCRGKAGFKKSVSVSVEVVELFTEICIEAQKDFEFEPIEEVKQEIQNK